MALPQFAIHLQQFSCPGKHIVFNSYAFRAVYLDSCFRLDRPHRGGVITDQDILDIVEVYYDSTARVAGIVGYCNVLFGAVRVG